MNDRERELPFGQVFRKAFIVRVLKRQCVGRTTELMVGWYGPTSVL